jgi:hypothetical protein
MWYRQTNRAAILKSFISFARDLKNHNKARIGASDLRPGSGYQPFAAEIKIKLSNGHGMCLFTLKTHNQRGQMR